MQARIPACATRPAAALAAAVLVLVGGAAPAQDAGTQGLVDAVTRLERQLRVLERQVYRGAPAPPAAAAAAETSAPVPDAAAALLLVRFTDLEGELRTLTGQVEDIGIQVRRAGDRLDRLVADVDRRLRVLEGRSGAAAAAPPDDGAAQAATATAAAPAPAPAPATVADGDGVPQSPTVRTLGTISAGAVEAVRAGAAVPEGTRATSVAPRRQPEPPSTPVAAPRGDAVDAAAVAARAAAAPALPAGTPDAQYEFAYSFLLQRDFVSAETALRGFLGANADHPLAGNAQYWLGETHYVRGDYAQAARTFAEGYRSYPDSAKAADNLLKLGMSLGHLDRTEDACVTLGKLVADYPEAQPNILQRADRERTRLACP